MTERESKRARLDTVLDAHGLDELVLRDPANLAWYLGGARVHVVPLEDTALATTHRPEILSPDPEWPAVAAGGRQRPDVPA
jgi:hypothetical protein